MEEQTLSENPTVAPVVVRGPSGEVFAFVVHKVSAFSYVPGQDCFVVVDGHVFRFDCDFPMAEIVARAVGSAVLVK